MPDDPDKPFHDEDGFLPADTPPPWGTEAWQQRISRLNRTARELPPSPGVYLMKDHEGAILYVGKASKLCDRVSSYFLPSTDLGPKKNPMLAVVHCFDAIVCTSEWEAILMENRLIKDIRPPYNSRQTDDRTFPYLVVTMRDDFPGVYITREPNAERFKGARVFGPFTAVGELHEAVQMLQRVFKYRTCTISIRDGDPQNKFFRPCLLHAIGQCTAPCADKISKQAYREDIDRFSRFISSKRRSALRELYAEMKEASASLEYERAATIRDQIDALNKLDERGHASAGWQPETEIHIIDPEKGLRSLQRTLELDKPVRCIEGFDIAHLQGDETVGSKVCFVDGKPFKGAYRRYRVKSANNDDYASLREVISRRYREAGRGNELYPDVVLIDGGLGQLHAAMDGLQGMDIQPPMLIALAKKEELIYTRERSEPIKLGRDNPGLRLCQSVRDEAHRFAQHYHHVLRRNKTLGR